MAEDNYIIITNCQTCGKEEVIARVGPLLVCKECLESIQKSYEEVMDNE